MDRPIDLNDRAPKGVDPGQLLTEDEHKLMDLTADLCRLLASIVGTGKARQSDLSEGIGHIHALQNMILAQAAARAYPGKYRLLGGTIEATSPHTLCVHCAAMPGDPHRTGCPRYSLETPQ